MQTFKLALAQYPLLHHHSETEWKYYVLGFGQFAATCQILAFPEYGSLDLASLLEPEERRAKNLIEGMQKFIPLFLETYGRLAQRINAYVVAPSFPVLESGGAVNRVYVFSPMGEMGFQDKHKLTRFESDEWKMVPGSPFQTAFETEFGRFGINIGYDVEFPLFANQLAKADVKLLLVPSCTETFYGMNRIHLESRARALENQIYVGVSQTTGEAPWSPVYDFHTGQALLCGPPDLGFPEDGIIAKGDVNQPSWIIHTVDFSRISRVRSTGSFLNWHDSQV